MHCRAQHPEHLDRLAARQTWTLPDAWEAIAQTEAKNRRQRAELSGIMRDLPARHRTVIKGLLRSETQREIGARLGIKQPATSAARKRAIGFARYMLTMPRPGWTFDRIRAELAGRVDAELLEVAICYCRGATSGPIAERLGVPARKARDIIGDFEVDLLALAIEAGDVLAERIAHRRLRPPVYAACGWSRGRRLRPERPRRPVQLDLFAASYRASGSTTHPN